MPDNTPYTPIQATWIKFTDSVSLLLIPQPDDEPLNQYLAFRDAVLKIVQGQQFLTELNVGWEMFITVPNSSPPTRRNVDISNALLMELQAFPLAVEVAQAAEKDSTESKGWVRRWFGKLLGKASTAAGSVEDLIEDLPPYAKMAITLFKELIEIFKGKD
jgi:hypothetical protein